MLMFLKMQNIQATKMVFPFPRLDIIYVAMGQVCLGYARSELMYARVNSTPKIQEDSHGGKMAQGSV